MRRVLLATLAAATLLAALAPRQGVRVTELTLPDEDLYRPALAVDPEGKLMLAALAYDGGADRVVAWTSEDGRRWAGPETLSDERGGYEHTRVVAADPDHFAVIYQGIAGRSLSIVKGKVEMLDTFTPENSSPAPQGTASAWDGEDTWWAGAGVVGSYGDPDFDIGVSRTGASERQRVGLPGADLQPTLLRSGDRTVLVWTNSYFPTRTNGELQTVGYDRWADKVYCVAWQGEDGTFGEPLELRLTNNERSGTTISDQAFPVAGERDGEVWIVYGEVAGADYRLLLCRVDPERGASEPVPIGMGRLGPVDQVGVARRGERLLVAHTVHMTESGERPAHSELAVLSIPVASLPARKPLAPREAQPRKAAVPGLDLANDGRTERPRVEQGSDTLAAYFGNLHLHSDLSRDARGFEGSPEMNYAVAQGIAKLDFAMLSDHVEALVFTDWWSLRKVTDMWNRPGEFVTLPGYEWTSFRYGHKNVVFPDTEVADDSATFGAQDGEREYSPDDLWEFLGGRPAITIPHHMSHGVPGPTDWSFRSDEYQRLAEIFQLRGSYEYDGAPYQKRGEKPPFFEGRSVQDALAAGHRLGIVASPDHGGGMGLAGVWASELTRAGVFEALHARRTWGTTGAKMALFLRVAGEPQGSEVVVAPGPVAVEARVDGTAAGLELTLVSNGEELWTRTFEERAARVDWADERPLEGTRYYYLRARQGDGHVGWTSPVWVDTRP